MSKSRIEIDLHLINYDEKLEKSLTKLLEESLIECWGNELTLKFLRAEQY